VWRPSWGEQPQNLALARSEFLELRTRPDRGRLSLRRQTADPCDQLVGIDRFHEIVVAADEKSGDLVGRLRPLTGDEDHRQIGAVLVLQLATDLVPGAAGQDHVEEHRRGSLVSHRIDRSLSRPRLARDEARSLERLRHERAIARVVIDDEE
jgi:hypothetical protein